MSNQDDDIWMVEVGVHGWSRLCRSYHEAYVVGREQVRWLGETQGIEYEQVLISLNGVRYTQLIFKSGK